MDKKLRILIVEDAPTDADLAERELRNAGIRFASQRVETKTAYLDALREFEPDVILSDYALPAFDGMTALKIAQELVPGTPFILTTGSINEETAVACMRAGAFDYILKDHVARLAPAVRSAVEQRLIREAKEEAEAKLRESMLLYKTLFDSANDAIMLMKDGRYVDCNPRTPSMFGCTREQFLNRKPAEFSPMLQPDGSRSSKKAAELITASLGGERQFFEWKHRRNDGTPFDAEVSLARIQLKSNTFIQAIVRDISDRKRAEEAVREADRRYREAVETAPDVIYTLDIKGRLTFANPAGLRLVGLTLDDLCTRKYHQMVPPAHRKEVKKFFRQELLSRAGSRYIECPILTADGSAKWYGHHASMILVGNDVQGFHVIARDISERKQAEEALRSAEEKYHSIVDNASDGIYQSTPDGRFITVNRAFARMLGYEDTADLLESAVSIPDELYVDRTRRQVMNHMLAVDGSVARFEAELVRKDGLTIWVSESGRAVNDAKGTLQYYEGIVQDITDRKRAEQELRQSEERFRGLLQSAPYLAVQGYAADGTTQYWNRASEHLYGYREGEALGRNILELIIPPEMRERVRQEIEAMASTGQPVPAAELSLMRRDGSRVSVFRSHALVRIPGRSPELFHIDFDLTERKNAEESLIKLQKAVDASGEAIFLTDLEGTFTYVNPGFTALYGYHAEDVIGTTTPRILQGGRMEPSAYTTFWSTRLRGHEFRGESVNRRKDGTLIDVEATANAILDDSGKAIGFLGIQRDVTARKRAEQELRLLAQSISAIKDCVSITDLENRLIFVNDAFQRVYGYSAEDLLGQNVALIRSPNIPKETVEQILPATIAGGWNGEIENRRKDGTLFPVELWTSVVRDDTGQLLALVGVARDVSERKALEQQLRQVQKLESIGTLAGGIAHDFNNILAIIMGHAAVVRASGADAGHREKSIKAIDRAVLRGSGLVRQILTFARKTDVLFEPINANEVVSEIVLMMSETFPKSITVEARLARVMPPVSADRTQVHQTLLNLCVNARDAMPNGGTLTLATERVPAGTVREKFAEATAAEYICISASDTGTGMDQATREHLFEPFFTTKEQGKGTGLGLAVVYGIVESHHGFIDVESTLGKGTTFRIFFPAGDRDVEIPVAKKRNVGEIPGGTETLLIIEDERMLRDLLEAALGAKGYTVLAASDGKQGLTLYREHQNTIALVITDLGLPKMDGVEVFRQVRELNPKQKVMIASGYMEPETRAKLLEMGAGEFIQKPYALDDALELIRAEIDRKPA
jgi:two-component system, cell cycle sensor histidine kinase and response regulator CckA